MPDTFVGRLSSHPWVTILSFLFGLFGSVWGLYSHFSSQRYPELVYFVNPIRSVVVKQGSGSRLSISIDGTPITQDVSVTQISVWNRGKEIIRKSSVLEPIRIRTKGNAPILEAKLMKTSRGIINFKLDQSQMAKGELQLDWNLLEQGDGGLFQIVYAGGSDLEIFLTGIVEGQPALKEFKYVQPFEMPKHFVGHIRVVSERFHLWISVATCAFGIIFLILGLYLGSRFLSVAALMLIILVLFGSFRKGIAETPFGLDEIRSLNK